MADVKWIKITTDVFDDEKIRLIELMPQHDTIIVIWFKLLCQCGKSNQGGLMMMNDKLAYTEEMLAQLFNRPLQVVRMALNAFQDLDMIELVDNTYYINNWEKHQNIEGLEKIKLQNSQRQKRYRDKHKALLLSDNNVTSNVESNVTSRSCNGTDKDKEEDINTMFESLWKKYPRKEGKGKVSKTQKKKLYELGDEIVRCIERYKQAKQGSDKNFLQMGSTFFNSGYVDYLDENFEATKPVGKVKGKKVII